MKCSEIQIILKKELARDAGVARLLNEDDDGVTTEADVEAYTGARFEENQVDCMDLHIVYRDGIACINFVDEQGVRVNYDYPIHTLNRIKHKANEFLHSIN